MNHPYIIGSAEHQNTLNQGKPLTSTKGVLIALLIAVVVLAATSCDTAAVDDEISANTTAFHPSKPSHAQQVAYREEAREQLHARKVKGQRQ